MTTVKEVLSVDSIYIKLKPVNVVKGKWDGDIEVTMICPDQVGLDEEGKTMLSNVGSMMAASLVLFEEHEYIKELAEDVVYGQETSEYMLEPPVKPTVESVTGNVIKLNFTR